MLFWADYYFRWWRLPIEERACRKTDLGGGDYYLRNSGLPPSYDPSPSSCFTPLPLQGLTGGRPLPPPTESLFTPLTTSITQGGYMNLSCELSNSSPYNANLVENLCFKDIEMRIFELVARIHFFWIDFYWTSE